MTVKDDSPQKDIPAQSATEGERLCPVPYSKADTPHVLWPKRGHSQTVGTRLTDRDCDLEQVQRIGEFTVYHRTKARRSRGYECGFIAEGERYPSANAWGRDDVSVPDLDGAMERLAESVRIGAVASWVRISAIARLRKEKLV